MSTSVADYTRFTPPVERTGFRLCGTTGRLVHRQADALIKYNAVASILALLIGVIAALGLVLTRWPGYFLKPGAGFMPPPARAPRCRTCAFS